jgi:mannose-6-phosphate isomerase-like protein (cupin superfamily)
MFHGNIDDITERNRYFRRVLSTTPTMQVVAMSLRPGEEIGSEVHPYITQFVKIEKGTGVAVMDNIPYELFAGVAVVIPAGTQHNIINTSRTEYLRLYTVYSPPNHPRGRLDLEKPRT